ncbi:hypothetical protein BD310DRAFT_815343, partial [Dichomitus squalens]
IIDVTLVLWYHTVDALYKECCRTVNVELCAALENILLTNPFHRVVLTVPGRTSSTGFSIH